MLSNHPGFDGSQLHLKSQTIEGILVVGARTSGLQESVESEDRRLRDELKKITSEELLHPDLCGLSDLQV